MLLESSTPIVTPDMAYLDALVKALEADDAIVALARNYHNGIQETYMTERVEEFLNIHDEDIRPFCLNICRTITLAVKDELSVSGFNTSETADASGIKAQAKWAWDLWTACRMDAVQSEVHESALSDRETFIIEEWDYKNNRPRFIHNYRYTAVEDGGDGQGVWMIYKNDDVNQEPVCAVKEWLQTSIDKTGRTSSQIRRTIYFPDRIEKWIQTASKNWEHAVDQVDKESGEPAEPWPIPWKDKAGKALGIPVIHFHNVGMMPEAWDAISIQDAVNKTLVDILASNDLTAFQMLVALGWFPTTDGEPPKADRSNLLKVGPGQFFGTKDPNGKVEVIKGQDPTGLIAALQDLIVMAAQVTGTPTSRFTTTKLIAAAETLKTQDQQLKKKAQDRRVLFGDAWEECMVIARRLTNHFSKGEPLLDETVTFFAVWLNSQTLDDLIEKKSLGVPEEILWAEAGYSTEQIAIMKGTPEYQARIAGWESSIYLSKHPELRNAGATGTSDDKSSDTSTDKTVDKFKADKKSATNVKGEKPKGT